MEVILDTNFIISCMKRRISFIERLKEEGFRVLIPKEIIEELKDLKFNVSHEDKTAIVMALELLDLSKDVEKTRLGSKKVDESLIEMGKKGVYIATLDAAIRHIVPNKIGISNEKNDILIERS